MSGEDIGLYYSDGTGEMPKGVYWAKSPPNYYSVYTLERVEGRMFNPHYIASFSPHILSRMPSEIVYARKDIEDEEEIWYEYLLMGPLDDNTVYVLTNQRNYDIEVNDFVGFNYYLIRIPSEESIRNMTGPSSLQRLNENSHVIQINVDQLEQDLLTGSVRMFDLNVNTYPFIIGSPREPLIPHPERRLRSFTGKTYSHLLKEVYRL